MPGVALDRVPTSARTAWLALRDALQRVLGDDLVAMWAYGGTVAVEDPAHSGDLDTYVILSRRPDEATTRAIEDAQGVIASAQGVEWDAWYVLAEEARGLVAPRHAWHDGRRDTSWAINRAHWAAGRYVNLHGPEPAELLTSPTWEELERELSRELEHVERHVAEGDTDPFEATYAILNGSRILRALASHDVAISKRDAGRWALETVSARWHPVLRAAMRVHEGQPAAGDVELLAQEMAAFVAFVRERMPPTADRPPDSLPRWSGY